MTQIHSTEILETIRMVSEQNFDVRTITIGIDLHDCISPDINTLNRNIYNKISRIGKDLVATATALSAKYGVPIVNQRIAVTPIAQIAAATGTDSYVSVAETLDKAAKAIGVSFIGGFSALVHKGLSPTDCVLIASIPEAMRTTDIVCASINIGSTRAGINMDAVKLAADTIKHTAAITPEGFGCAKIVVFCNAVEELGQLLDHTGPVAASERNAARIFNADHLFFVTNGTSTSNKIVWNSAVAPGDIVIVDRNCHKSILHSIIMTGAIPVFLMPTRNHFGIIGPIPKEEFRWENIEKKISNQFDQGKKILCGYSF